jgi:hypothetical protein
VRFSLVDSPQCGHGFAHLVVRRRDIARKPDPQLARIYFVQIVERGKDHLGRHAGAGTAFIFAKSRLGSRPRSLAAEIAELEVELRQPSSQATPELLGLFGLGPEVSSALGSRRRQFGPAGQRADLRQPMWHCPHSSLIRKDQPAPAEPKKEIIRCLKRYVAQDFPSAVGRSAESLVWSW